MIIIWVQKKDENDIQKFQRRIWKKYNIIKLKIKKIEICAKIRQWSLNRYLDEW